METRELYKQKYEAQLREWGAKIDVLKAEIDKRKAEAKIDAQPQLDDHGHPALGPAWRGDEAAELRRRPGVRALRPRASPGVLLRASGGGAFPPRRDGRGRP